MAVTNATGTGDYCGLTTGVWGCFPTLQKCHARQGRHPEPSGPRGRATKTLKITPAPHKLKGTHDTSLRPL